MGDFAGVADGDRAGAATRSDTSSTDGRTIPSRSDVANIGHINRAGVANTDVACRSNSTGRRDNPERPGVAVDCDAGVRAVEENNAAVRKTSRSDGLVQIVDNERVDRRGEEVGAAGDACRLIAG